MIFIIFIICIVLCFVLPLFRVAFLNPVKSIWNALKDVYLYIVHRGWNSPPTGKFDVYTGLFGQGKSLSLTHYVHSYYRKYNGRLSYNTRLGKMLPNRIIVMSNIVINGVDCTPLTSMSQLLDYTKTHNEIEETENVNLYCLFVVDEMSTVFNSRSFKDNFNGYTLNTLLTARHYGISIFGTSQRFGHIDALLRQVCQNVIECKKIWRFQLIYYYDAWEMENCTNPTYLKPMSRKAWFVRNKDYNNYDTYAVVSDVEKKVTNNDFIPDTDIVNLVRTNQNKEASTYKRSYLKQLK